MSGGPPDPPPPDQLDPLLRTWEAGTPIFRCHNASWGATEYNGSPSPGRFRPFDDDRRVVPTIYGADVFEGALSESVFHDVPVRGGSRKVLAHRLRPVVRNVFAPKEPLKLVALTSRGLARLGLHRTELIDTPPDAYPFTARWASALYAHETRPHGLLWVSRQYDESYAVVLFEPRVPRDTLEVVDVPLPLGGDPGLGMVRTAAEEAGIALVV